MDRVGGEMRVVIMENDVTTQKFNRRRPSECVSIDEKCVLSSSNEDRDDIGCKMIPEIGSKHVIA